MVVAFLAVVLLLLISSATAAVVNSNNNPLYACAGGECQVTSHAFRSAIDQSQIIYADEAPIKEWHFHIYFFQTDNSSVTQALYLQNMLVSAVSNHEFLCVPPGVDAEILPALANAHLFPVHYGPFGPHPVGNYEVWVPYAYFTDVMSFMMLHRGELSVLLHPISNHTAEDHFGRSMWLGHPFYLIFEGLVDADGHFPDSEYPTLELGYAYNANSDYAPANWKK